MSNKLKIYTYPDSVLRAKAETIENIDEDVHKLIDSMIETMYDAPGIGLAANQVGVARQLIVYDVSSQEEGQNPSVLINPEIVVSEGEAVYEEACLSVLDFAADVTRSSNIKVKGVDKEGNPIDIEADGLLAVCLQHEIDHLNGKLFIDHVSSLKRSLYKKRLKKMMQD